MEIDAGTLLSEYKKNKARVSIIRAMLDAAPEEIMSDDAKLAEMAAGRRAPDGMPVSRGHGSTTEYVALHYHDEAQRQRDRYFRDMKALEEELRDIEQQIAVHDAALNVLSSMETELVRLHYDELLSLSQIIEEDAFSGRIHSLSSLRRLHRGILRKVNDVLKPGGGQRRVV